MASSKRENRPDAFADMLAALDEVDAVAEPGRLDSAMYGRPSSPIAPAIVEAVKGVFKFTVVIVITYNVMRDNVGSFLGFLHSDAAQSLMFGKYLMVKLGFSILLGLGVIALADFGCLF